MSEKKEVKKVQLSDLFATTNEKNGIWYEARIHNKGIGLEFKLHGASSDENILSAEKYKKEHEEVEKIENIVEKENAELDIICDRVTAMICDMRVKEGYDFLDDNGEPIKYSKELVRKLVYENADIRSDLFQASFRVSNFMKKKY